MSILVVAEHDNSEIKGSTLNTVTAASKIGGDVSVLVAETIWRILPKLSDVVAKVPSASGKVKTLCAPPDVDAGACKDTDPEVEPTNFIVMLLSPLQ